MKTQKLILITKIYFLKNGHKRNPTILDTLLFRYQSKLYMYCNCKMSI